MDSNSAPACSGDATFDREQVGLGTYWYSRPGWSRFAPIVIENGRGGFGGQLMVRFYTDVIPGLLRDVPTDAYFQVRTDGLPLRRAHS